jgi:hypothetical protein
MCTGKREEGDKKGHPFLYSHVRKCHKETYDFVWLKWKIGNFHIICLRINGQETNIPFLISV